MNKEYLRSMTVAENALIQIKGIYDKAKIESFEDRKSCKSLERLIESMEDFVGDIKHYSKDTEQGYLQLNSNGRYVLNSTELTCGYPIELWDNKCHEWEDGRIEHSSKYGGYYFYNYDNENKTLNEGLKVRIRV